MLFEVCASPSGQQGRGRAMEGWMGGIMDSKSELTIIGGAPRKDD